MPRRAPRYAAGIIIGCLLSACGARTHLDLSAAVARTDAGSAPRDAMAPDDAGPRSDGSSGGGDASADATPDARSDAGPDASAPACSGPPFILATKQSPTAIALTADRIYWSNDRSIRSIAKSGGPVVDLAVAGDSWGIAVDATRVYWSDRNGPLSSVPAQGGPTTVLASSTFGDGLVADDANVYWGDNATSVWSVPKTGGAPRQLAQLQASPGDVAVDSSFVYWTNWGSGDVARAPLTGGATATLVGWGASSPYKLAVDDQYVYWTAQGTPDTGVYRAFKPGTGPNTQIASGGAPNGIALDDQFVYWTDFAVGNVWKTPKGGGSSIPVATGQTYVRAVAVDDGCVYWTTDCCGEPDSGYIVKGPK